MSIVEWPLIDQMGKLKKVRDESKPQWVGGKKKDFPEIAGKVRSKREDGDQNFLQSKMLIRSNNQFRNCESEFSRIF